jgi:hypothetical protein
MRASEALAALNLDSTRLRSDSDRPSSIFMGIELFGVEDVEKFQ